MVLMQTQPQPPRADLPLASVAAPEQRVQLLGMSRTALGVWIESHGEKRFRTDQILEWIYRRHAENFDAMTNLSKPLRAALTATATLGRAQVARESKADDGTQKWLLEWPDGAAVETVWIPEQGRNTACLSSQVGCPVGCRFCASGLDGVQRNLTAGEIVEQALLVSRGVAASTTDREGRPARLSNIVMMGMGEPLANYREVVKAIRILNASWGLGLGARKITVSTVGLPKQIRTLADEDLQLNLALSLHAPDNELRRKLIPWSERFTIDELLDACAYYFERTGREITLEYVLLADVNDRPRHARGLARCARRLRANVNLLRYNPVAGLPYQRPTAEAAYAFQRKLREHGVNAHVRTSRGSDVAAACGQLRRAAHPT